MAKSPAFSRREFLRTGVTGGAALVVGFRLSASAFTGQAAEQEKKPPNPFDAWVSITPDNRVRLILGKSEMGQGIMTALPMILAEELCVDWKNVKVEQAPTNPKIYDLGTGGSGSVAGSWLPLRRAGAAAREMLIAAAAQKWEVGVDTCKAVAGKVIHGNPNRYLSYGELVETAAKLPIPNFNTVPLKNSNDFTLVGHDTRRYEVRDKATGAATFGIDSRVPGMLYAVVARCPVFGGKVVSFDAAKAKAVPGVRDVIAFETSGRGASTTGGIAVLAVNSWAAMQGRNALEVKWDLGPAAKESSAGLHEQFLANAAKLGKIVRNDGDADSVLASSAKTIEAAYEFPFAPHACMEPMNCTVHIRPDGAEAPEQGEFGTGSTIPYQTPNIRIEYTLAESSVPRAWWRSVEHSTSGFVVESFIDELAVAAGQDPLAFRLKLIGPDRKIPLFDAEKAPPLDTARLKGVLQLAAEKAGWGKPLPKGQGRGIAAFYSFDSYTAAVAEVSVKNGAAKLERLVYAVDCGRPINPEGIRAQVESAAIYGLSAASYDAITISGGRVEQSNFNDYQMPRMNDAPKTEVHVVMSKEEPTGIGEPGLPVVAPAMCNAIFAATGKRLRRLPIQPKDLA